MKTTICVVCSAVVLASAAFGGGNRDQDPEEIVMVSRGVDIADSDIAGASYMGMLLMFADELELTAEQEARIIDIEVEYGDNLERLLLRIQQIELDIRKNLHEGAPLEAIKPLLEDKAALYAEEEWLELVQWDAEIQVLTPEQRKRWKVLERDYFFFSPEGAVFDHGVATDG